MSLSWPRTIAERASCALLLPALGWGIYTSARLTAAESAYRLNTPASLAEAVRLEPGNASYRQLLAEHLESEGRDPLPDRLAAASLSPRESRYWIDLGTAAEVRSDLPAAERFYLKAASVDRMFAPREALMNFYFRQHNVNAFLHWVREALPMAHDDVSSIFKLCWLMTNDPESIRAMIPKTGFLTREYLRFLIDNKHAESAPPVAKDLAEHATGEEATALLDYCSQAAIVAPFSALDVWNALSRRGQHPYGVLDPQNGKIVTNSDFRIPPVEKGFDWRIEHIDGISVTLSDSGLGVELTGDQPQLADIVTQFIPLTMGTAYRIDYSYSAELSDAASRQPSGFTWVIHPIGSNEPTARSSDLTPTGNDATGSFEFTATGSSATLGLRYQRPSGTVRRAEKLIVHRISSRRP